MRAPRTVALRTLALCLAACASVATGCTNGVNVYVQLQTDYVAGVEFDEVLVQASDRRSVAVNASEHFARPVQVAEYGAVALGRFDVEVSLRLRGRVVTTARRRRDLQRDAVVAVILTRDCRAASCPAPSNAAATECIGNQCVPPECDDLTSCGTAACAGDGDCTASTACVRTRCVRGVCLALSEPAACPTGERCVPDLGCVLVEGTPDAGIPDAGPPDADLPDAPPDDAWRAPPSFTLRYLAPGAGAWSEVAVDPDAPTTFAQALLTRPGHFQLVVVTADALTYLSSSGVVVGQTLRDTVFPELAGTNVVEGVTVGTTVFLYASSVGVDLYRYVWDGIAARATLVSVDPVAWTGSYRPSTHSVHGIFYANNDQGWVDTNPVALCGRTSVGAYVAFVTFDGIGPGRPTVAIYDEPCMSFVDRISYERFTPLYLSGAPDEGSVTGLEWMDGLYAMAPRR